MLWSDECILHVSFLSTLHPYVRHRLNSLFLHGKTRYQKQLFIQK